MDGLARLVDIHSHILPGVDDGAQSLAQTEAMLLAAKKAGARSIIATPHLSAHEGDFERISNAYWDAKPIFDQNDVELLLGYECRYESLTSDLDVRKFAMADTNVVLLEFSTWHVPVQWENGIAGLRRRGIEIIIAHPERYISVQRNIGIAERMVQIGCELQISAASLCGRILANERRCAIALLNKGLAGYIASDAHCAEDYRVYARISKKYGVLATGGALLSKLGGKT